jgi:uncharacterized protein
MARPLVIGVLSDTHGLLRPEALARLAGVDRIVHAGDVGRGDILARLARIAPVTAVRGNVDGPELGLPDDALLVVRGRHVYVVHDVADLGATARAASDVVVSGHSHRPSAATVGGVLMLNPGAAGPRRFRLPVTLATLTVGPDGALAAAHHTLV